MQLGKTAVILGGGGFITRQFFGDLSSNTLEVLMVHRPKHQDWSLPAGKLDRGEDLAECALREVHEETGYVCELGRELGSVDYLDQRGRMHQVHYWEMDVVDGSFAPNSEVDHIMWVPLEEASDYFSNPRDVQILNIFMTLAGNNVLV
ncbi:MAG: NUDIX hydrolase [Acidimicrobiia bacterium]|nr:NUDIX hydrolase [Acidimicrobiia bacterium]MYC57110.1 NUDIX hydrolase [Acidimicrobiia bacterium]MYG94788.1 NUDIX hydrolase [Acidimicrobiia bacterium]MYI30187.1 NUDIX hydrolase [Acidimicrobiia bacterium]